MKTSMISAASVAILSAIASAIPLQERTASIVRIQLEIESDTFIQEDIPFGIVVPTSQHPRLSSGIDLSIATITGVSNPDSVSCQAFSDAHGTKRLGDPFTQLADTILGGHITPTHIGSIKCSAYPVKARDTEEKRAAAEVRIQLEIELDTFIQDVIPFGVVVSTKNHARLSSGIDLIIATITGLGSPENVKCQAFSDDQGKHKLGGEFTLLMDTVLGGHVNPVHIGSYKCS